MLLLNPQTPLFFLGFVKCFIFILSSQVFFCLTVSKLHRINFLSSYVFVGFLGL